MKKLGFLKNFFVLGILILSFAACSSSKQSDKGPDPKDPPGPGTENTPPSFDKSINTKFSFDESIGAELAKPSKIQGVVLEAKDPDDDTLTYKLVEVDAHPGDHTHFTVNSKTGQIAKKKKNYDYETKNSYTFAVKVSDDASPPQSDQIQVTLTVNNLNETPLAPTGLTISSGDSKLVVGWRAPDNTGRPEITDYIIYWDTTSGGTANEEMSSGDTIYTLTGLNNNTTYYIHVKAKNADGLGKTSLIESGTPVSGNSRPVIQGVVDQEVGEGQTSSVTVQVLDTDNGDTITLTATSGTPAAITVPSQIPAQTVANGSVSFTFDVTAAGTAGSSSTITLTATDDSGDSTTNTSLQSTFDVDVIEFNAAPTFSGITNGVISFDAAENQRAIGTVSAIDGNSEDTVTYSIPQLANEGGVDREKFTIESTTGILSFSPNFLPDKEAASDSLQPAIAGAPENAADNNEYIVVVRATSGARDRRLHTDQAIKITVTNINEAPVFSSTLTTTFSIQEDVGSDIGTASAITNAIVTATDPDSDTLTYTLEEVSSHTGDHNDFTIDSTGQISRKNQNYDYEDQSSYTFAVKAADADFSSQIEVTINISNNNTETPLAPTGLTTTSGDSQLVVNWQPPSNTGRPNISGYKVYWDTTSGGTANEHTISTATTTTYTITSLTNGTTYYVHVKAVNADGEGAASPSVSSFVGNSPPTIQVVSQKIKTGGVIQVTVEVQDPNDGDIITLTATSADTSLVTVPSITTQAISSGSATFIFDITVLTGENIGDLVTITLNAQDNEGNSSDANTFDVEIITSHKFISQWTVAADGDTITLPLRSGFSYNFSVDWGDGNTSEIDVHDDTDRVHTYTNAGDYTVIITGVVEAWFFNGKGDKNKITSVTDLGDVGWINLNSAFEGCENLVGFAGGDVSSVTNMGDMFRGASSVTPETIHWDVSSVTSMSDMFRDASLANPDVSHWTVSSVTNMNHMFSGASIANPDVSNWDVSSVTNMHAMFINAAAADPNTSNWTVSSVTNMGFMFTEATMANPDVSNWDVSNVTNMKKMFYQATSADPDMSSWNFSSVTDMSQMLYGLTLDTVDYSNLLIQIRQTAVETDVSFHGGNSKYNASASTARDELINNLKWTIKDGGEDN